MPGYQGNNGYGRDRGQQGANGRREQPGGPGGSRRNDSGAPATRPVGAEPRVTSAYNFVPLAEKVVLPPWQDRVSHDLPLQGGLCAELAIRLQAHTPLLVGSEREGGGGPQQPVEFHTHPDGVPAIPGSALRGMLRSVLEVLTFARMQHIDDRWLSMRDLHAKAYTGNFVRRAGDGWAATSRGGWLRFDEQEGRWTITECEVGRIEQEELGRLKSARQPGKSLRQCLYEAWRDCSDKDAQRFARLKYEVMEGKVAFFLRGDAQPRPYPHQEGRLTLHYRKFKLGAKDADSVPGYLVLTGQPGKLEDGSTAHRSGTKHMEFVFIPRSEPLRHEVEPEVMRAFREIYADSKDLTFLESTDSPHAKRGVPVFFLTERQSGRERVTSLGLSQMYRLPAARSLGTIAQGQQAPRQQEGSRLDFVETLFGYATEDDSLKGRVSMGDLRLMGSARGNAVQAEERFRRETVLGQPKPGFYPNYLVQPGANARGEVEGEHVTQLSKEAALRGWKRYPVRPLAEVEVPEPPIRGSRANTRLNPLKPGVMFEGKVRLHNVTHEELGALLWALDWGGDANLRHALGMGKPFGFGQVSVQVDIACSEVRPNDPDAAAPSLIDCRAAFENFMEGQLDGRWRTSAQLAELLAMANPRLPQANRTTLAPLKLQMQGENQFAEVKGAKRSQRRALLPYSKQG